MTELVASARSNLCRSGHAACWSPALNAVVAFGGIMSTSELSDEAAASAEITSSPLYLLPVEQLCAMLEPAGRRGCGELPSSSRRMCAWQKKTSAAMPRTRHGHVMVAHGGDLFVFGGCHWAHGDVLASLDLRYEVATNSWRPFDSQVPPRFCAASAYDMNSGELFLFGGIAGRAEKEPTALLHRISLSDFTVRELPQAGQAPAAQFKSSMTILRSGSLLHFEGLTATDARALIAVASGASSPPRQRPAAGMKACHLYTPSTGLWRVISQSPDIVRSQIICAPLQLAAGVPTEVGHGDSEGAADEAAHVELVTLFGGMQTFPGAQFRTARSFTFNATHRLWEPSAPNDHNYRLDGGSSGNGRREVLRGRRHRSPEPQPGSDRTERAGGVSAHAVAQFDAGTCDLFSRFGVLSCSHGGNADRDHTSNNRGEQVDTVHIFRLREMSLKETVARWIHRWRVPYMSLGDPLLDELF